MKAVRLFSIILTLFWLADLAVPAAAAQAPRRSQIERSAGRQAAPAAAPGAFSKLNPPDGSTQPTNPILRWANSSGATSYQYCVSLVDNDNTCSGSWTSAGTNTSVILSGLSDDTIFYWQVRAVNIFSQITNANAGTWWSFTTGDVPGSFFKSAPSSGSGDQSPNTTLSWGASSGATSYQYCYDTSNNNACDAVGGWSSAGTNTSATTSDLKVSTTYYWQVRAVNGSGSTEADGGVWRYFVVRNAITSTVINKNDSGPGSLRQAISDAASGDTINFDNNYTIYLASTLSFNKNLTVDGSGHNITVSGDSNQDGDQDVEVFSIGVNAVVSLTALNVVKGRTSVNGGGIDNQGNLTLESCLISGNTAAGSNGGGGIYNDFGATLVGNLITVSNNSDDYNGGGIANYGNMTLSMSEIDGNTTIINVGKGAGILNANGATLVINEASNIFGNTAIDNGGGIENYGSLTVTNSTFSGNQVTDPTKGMGGGIDNSGNLTIQGSTFVSNVSFEDGGAINSDGIANLDVTNSTFSDNSAGIGGAIFIESTSSLTIVKNSTLAGNHASQYGGGIHVGYGGKSLTIQNSILAGNTAPTGANCGGAVTDGGNNLVWGDTSCPPYVQQDPQLGLLASNGGPTQTMAPALGSPAVDAYDTNCPATDQRGVTRPQGAHCDIGAVEVLTVSGNAGVSGVSLSYNDGGAKTATSGLGGGYVFSVSSGWTGTITPSLTGYFFSPTLITITTPVTSDLTGQDFTAYVIYTIFLPLVMR